MKSLTGTSPVPECQEGELFKIINYDALLRHLQIIFERTVFYKACERGEVKGNNRRNKASINRANYSLNTPAFSNHHQLVNTDDYLVSHSWLYKNIASFIMPKEGRYTWRQHHETEVDLVQMMNTMEELKVITRVNENYELTWLKRCG